MRKVIFIIVAIALLFTFNTISVLGQELTPDSVRQSDFPHGKWGLQAQLGNPFIHNYDPPLFVIIKYRTNEKSIWRLGFSFDGNFRKDDSEYQSTFRIDTLGTVDTTLTKNINKNNSQDIDVFAQKIFYASPANKITFYWGLGPEMGLSHWWNGWVGYSSNYGSAASTEATSTYISVGLNGVLGAEYYPLKKVGFSVEYSIKSVYSHGTYKTNYGTSVSVNKQNDFSFYNSRAEFGITVYF